MTGCRLILRFQASELLEMYLLEAIQGKGRSHKMLSIYKRSSLKVL
jgi:hypothetical protein